MVQWLKNLTAAAWVAAEVWVGSQSLPAQWVKGSSVVAQIKKKKKKTLWTRKSIKKF